MKCFELTDEEEKKSNKWINKHMINCPPNRGTSYSYEFIPTGLGDVIKVKCSKCGETYDVTDYSIW